MSGLSKHHRLYVIWAYLFQLTLITHFALRKWAFDIAMQYGWIVYALSAVAVIISIVLLRGEQHWGFWVGGFLYFIWAVFGYSVEYLLEIPWRAPIVWPIFIPYLFLYLATVMFYWWPLARIKRSLWFGGTILFIISMVLNVTSH